MASYGQVMTSILADRMNNLLLGENNTRLQAAYVFIGKRESKKKTCNLKSSKNTLIVSAEILWRKPAEFHVQITVKVREKERENPKDENYKRIVEELIYLFHTSLIQLLLGGWSVPLQNSMKAVKRILEVGREKKGGEKKRRILPPIYFLLIPFKNLPNQTFLNIPSKYFLFSPLSYSQTKPKASKGYLQE